MTRISRIVIIGSALTTLIGATGAAAQEPAMAGLVTSIEVKQLIASGEPADQARLRDHFTALAAKYTVDAKRHESMGRALVGNPNRNTGTNLSAHCNRLAELATGSAAIARELAEHHDRLAAGVPSTAPTRGAALEQGAGAPVPRDKQILELAAGARTPSDHQLLEGYFTELAANYESDTKQHAAMAAGYRGNPRPSFSSAVAHCDRLVQKTREAAAEARAQANEHRSLAVTASK
jgi:hypothetical protein